MLIRRATAQGFLVALMICSMVVMARAGMRLYAGDPFLVGGEIFFCSLGFLGAGCFFTVFAFSAYATAYPSPPEPAPATKSAEAPSEAAS